MQHTPYQVKYQFDFKGELKEAKYEPTISDIKLKFEEMISSLHTPIDTLTKANHDAEIIAKIIIEKVSSGYEGTSTLRIDGSKYELIARASSDNLISLIADLHKKFVNEIHHKSH